MVDQSCWQLLQSFARTRRFQSGEAVFNRGDRADAIFRVESGQVQLYRYDINGQRILLYRALSGDFFAEASLDAEQYHCTAVCSCKTELTLFSAEKIRALLASNPAFCAFWVAQLSTELRRQRASVERLSLKSAAERVVHYLMTEGSPVGEIILHGTISEFADMLGLSRESLYRTLSKMKKQGVLQQQGKHLKLNRNKFV